ncbi:MAG: ComF family protein [Kangiellaceae bacterium]|nr:ComF family protein [Kangiellaceae bacterium]
MVYNYIKRLSTLIQSKITRNISATESSIYLPHDYLSNDLLSNESGLTRCSFCELSSPKTGICNSCSSQLIRTGYYCQQCGNSLTCKQPLCGSCLKKPPDYQRLIAAFDYHSPIDEAMSQMKFNRQLHLIKSLSYCLSQSVIMAYKEEQLPQLILPIPLHRKRLQERGFNQSLLIAQQLQHRIGINIDAHSLTRIKNTPHQIGLKAVERRRNLKGAFQILDSLPKHIALVDDVVTTGSTINEASKLCKKHGVERVDIWCLAKT